VKIDNRNRYEEVKIIICRNTLQIKDRNYPEKLKSFEKILLVDISYQIITRNISVSSKSKDT
jgi:hypothetical protein